MRKNVCSDKAKCLQIFGKYLEIFAEHGEPVNFIADKTISSQLYSVKNIHFVHVLLFITNVPLKHAMYSHLSVYSLIHQQ